MEQGRTIVVFGDDMDLADRLEADLSGASVLQPLNTGDLARTLTSGIDIDLFVARVRSERDRRVLEILREALASVDIVAIVDDGVGHLPDPTDSSLHVVAASAGADEVVDAITAVLERSSHEPVAEGEPDAAWEGAVPSARTVAVLGAGGGVGTTTVALALALEFSTDRNVVLVDLDARHGALAPVLRVQPTYTIDDLDGVMDDPESLDDALPMCLVEVRERLHLLAGPTWSTGSATLGRDIAVVRSLARTHDVVVIDLGARSPGELELLAECSDVVVVCSHDIVVVGRLGILGEAVDAIAKRTRHWTVLNQIRADGPSPASLASILGHGWSCEVPWSRKLRRVWNDPASTPGHGTNRSWSQIGRHLGWIVNASDNPTGPPTVPIPTSVRLPADPVVRIEPAEPAEPADPAEPDEPAEPSTDASTEEPTHV